MKRYLYILTLLFLLPAAGFSQNTPTKKVTVSGRVTEKSSMQPLEYATVTFFAAGDRKPVAGNLTDAKGNFTVEVPAGSYDIVFEFISFRREEIKGKAIAENTQLGDVALEPDPELLNEVVVDAEATTVEMKLDKKIYTVGKDLMVKGGTVSDVLNNVPSISVEPDGAVSLRGNNNVRVLIDGRPSNAINIAETLRMIPADAISKVEVITNPSARYDAEGGGGLINIILKKERSGGLNGVFTASAGDPQTYVLTGGGNYKTGKINVFASSSYNHRMNIGRYSIDSEYLGPDGSTMNFIDENRRNTNTVKGTNNNIGLDWFINKGTTWTNSVNIRDFRANNEQDITYDYFDAGRNFLFTDSRLTDMHNTSRSYEYATNFIKNFAKEGHTLTIDSAISRVKDNDKANINGPLEKTLNRQEMDRNIVQVDYVLPLGKQSQFEAGYKGDFNTLLSDFMVDTLDIANGIYIPDLRYTNTLEYKEKINAVYTQYGSKIGKLSYMAGLRWEGSDIDINQLMTDDYNNRKYDNLFPSLFLSYQLPKESSLSLSYSRRIVRPRGAQINPFQNYISNINISQGNPDLNPAFMDNIELEFMKRLKKAMFSTSVYFHNISDAYAMVRLESGDFATVIIDGTETLAPIIITKPINLSKRYRLGWEGTVNYSPYKWWKLNGNFNIARTETVGTYTYIDFEGNTVNQNFDNVNYMMSGKINSRITLPYKIDWQTNINYMAPQNEAQGHISSTYFVNFAFNKDVMKEKGTISLSIQDVFNSRKRTMENNIPGVLESESFMQSRRRTVILSFTYRFNRKKNEQDKVSPGNDADGGDEF